MYRDGGEGLGVVTVEDSGLTVGMTRTDDRIAAVL